MNLCRKGGVGTVSHIPPPIWPFQRFGVENEEFLEFDGNFFAFCDSADHDAKMSEWASKQQKSATQSTVCDFQLIMLMHPVVAELDRDCAASLRGSNL